MNGLSKFVELVLFQAGREHIVLFFDAAFYFLDEVGLLELNLVFLGFSDHVGGTLLVNSSLGVVAHYIFYSMESDRYISLSSKRKNDKDSCPSPFPHSPGPGRAPQGLLNMQAVCGLQP